MPRFNYVALDARGQESTGLIEASNTNDAVGQLRQAGYFPTSVYEEGKNGAGGAAKAKKSTAVAKTASKAPATTKKSGAKVANKAVKAKILMIFTRQLATLIDAGLPLLRGLMVLEKQERDPVLKATIAKLSDAVQGGSTFSEGLAQHPKIFNKLYINMVKAGEVGGVLELVLIRLAEFQEKAQKVKNKVVAAMFYPIIVLVIAVAIMGFLLVFIVPKFEQIFHDMLNGKPLPALTEYVIAVSRAVQTNWYIIIAVVAVLVVAYRAFASTAGGRVTLDKIKLRLPLFGDLVRKSSISRQPCRRRGHRQGARQRQGGRVHRAAPRGQRHLPADGDFHD